MIVGILKEHGRETRVSLLPEAVAQLKKKLVDAGCDNYLKTVYGTGYKWEG